MAPIVLVHGAYTGGWVWSETASSLTALGHVVYTPTLTGCGERSHLLRPGVGFALHVQDVSHLLFYQNLQGAILVGHGYGGMVAATVAHRLMANAGGMIHVDGVIPKRGSSYADLAGNRLRQDLAGQENGSWLVSPPAAETFGIADDSLRSWLSLRIQPFPQRAFTQANPYGAKVRKLPSAFVHCTGNACHLAKAMAARAEISGMRRVELEAGPYPMVTAPQELAVLIDQLAKEAANPVVPKTSRKAPRREAQTPRTWVNTFPGIFISEG
jgi:pimeloyl-ACP methyl ester carboxylesterase